MATMTTSTSQRAAREAETTIRRAFRNGTLVGNGRGGSATGSGYPPDQEEYIARQVAELLGYFPSLLLNANFLMHNRIIEVSGTVPMTHRGFNYYLPIGLILPHGFPRTPPYVSVRPTPDMVIKHQHPNVAGNGQVVTPYIRQWQPSSNLVDLVATMVIAFEDNPPLYQRPQQQQQSPPHPPGRPQQSSAHPSQQRYQYPQSYPAHGQTQQQYHAQFMPPNPSSSSVREQRQSFGPAAFPSNNQPNPTMAAMANSSSQGPLSRPNKQQQAFDATGDAFKTAAIAGLKRKLQADLYKLSTSATEEINTLLEAQKTLDLRYRTLKSFEDELVIEREALDKCLTSMTTRTSQLNKWLEENENAGLVEDDPEDESSDDQQRELKRVDNMFIPKDEMNKTLLSATARDQAIEDTIYALEEALTEGVVKLDDYLKKVRNLSREQYFARATIKKLSTKVQQ